MIPIFLYVACYGLVNYILKNVNTSIDILRSLPLLFYDSCLFYRFRRLVINVKNKSEKSKAPTSRRISPAPRIMKNYTADTV